MLDGVGQRLCLGVAPCPGQLLAGAPQHAVHRRGGHSEQIGDLGRLPPENIARNQHGTQARGEVAPNHQQRTLAVFSCTQDRCGVAFGGTPCGRPLLSSHVGTVSVRQAGRQRDSAATLKCRQAHVRRTPRRPWTGRATPDPSCARDGSPRPLSARRRSHIQLCGTSRSPAYRTGSAAKTAGRIVNVNDARTSAA